MPCCRRVFNPMLYLTINSEYGRIKRTLFDPNLTKALSLRVFYSILPYSNQSPTFKVFFLYYFCPIQKGDFPLFLLFFFNKAIRKRVFLSVFALIITKALPKGVFFYFFIFYSNQSPIKKVFFLILPYSNQSPTKRGVFYFLSLF